MKRWQVHVQLADSTWDAQGVAVRRKLHGIGLESVVRVDTSRVFIVEGDLCDDQVRRLSRELLCDPVSERFTISQTSRCPPPKNAASVEVHPRPGVMDPVADSIRLAVGDLGMNVDRVRTARRYEIFGLTGLAQLERAASRVLANDCIEHAYLCGFGKADFAPLEIPEPQAPDQAVRHIAIRELDDPALEKLSREGHLFLSLEEMLTIQNRFRALGRDPTDLEIETLAQTWSEHCVHKTLKSAVLYRGAPMPVAGPTSRVQTETVEIRYENLLRDTIARATRSLDPDWCLSVFEDNAGIIEFDEEFGIAFKVETHNHPSAIEPYGGAATGVGGCIRDVMGCGLGARPIANTDVFCLAPPDWPWERLPDGVLHPRAVLEGVVSGVRDYGNRMGIPTVNGALHFDPRYLANPLVYVGCVGIIPRNRIAKGAALGDCIVVAGGRTGRDGIHGATFSSAELTDHHGDEFAHAVQIGNPITQKKLLDCILQARDHADGCLYSSITDCGAGGLSSAVGEMGAEIGARVELDGVPLKYAGLRYDEIWISEAQERMVFAVPPERVETLLALFAAEDVEATVIGEFTDDKKLTVRYRGKIVGEIDVDFLHNGRPEQTLIAEWSPQKTEAAEPRSPEWDDPVEFLYERLADRNAASREWIIRQYDHEVGGRSVVTPLVGVGDGPGDAAVLRPRLDSERGIAIGCGLCSELSDEDPYWMAVAAVDEALRNVICVGGDPLRTAILDNFCWPACDDPRRLGELVRACQGAHDAAVAYGLPFISGKDSLNNQCTLSPDEARRCDLPETLAIPPTLLISAVSVIDDVSRCITSAARTDCGETEFWYVGHPAPDWISVAFAERLKVHRLVAQLIHKGLVLAAHDVGSEGVAVALAEMAIGGRYGMIVNPMGEKAPRDLFGSRTGGYLIQTLEEQRPAITEACTNAGVPSCRIAEANERRTEVEFVVSTNERAKISLNALERAWKSTVLA